MGSPGPLSKNPSSHLTPHIRPCWSYLWDAALSDLYLLGCDLALWDGDLKGFGLSHNSRGGQKAGEGNELKRVSVSKDLFLR